MISAVWLVRSHQIAGDLRYWLTYIGYDKRDHSLTHKIYLGYATLFFSAWGFATLALMASFVGGLVVALGAGLTAIVPGSTVAHAAGGVLGLALLGWWLYTGYRAGRASPMTFTEDDAALICQTPVSRPAVSLLWLLGEWIKRAPIFWALTVTLAFALQDASLGSEVSVEYVPFYVIFGLRALSVMLPLQWGLMALAWAWGVLRLERDRVRRFWWLGPLALAVALLVVLVSSGGLLAGFYVGPAGIFLAPLTLPLAAGYGLAAWGAGLAAGVAWGVLGSLGLGLASRQLNLGRAAQESTGRAAGEAAAQAGNAQAAADIALRQRLGVGHAPTRLPIWSGWPGLAWKALVGWGRRGVWSLLGPLAMIFFATLAIALSPDWGTRVWAIFAWLVAVEQFAAGPLVGDLRLWATFRGLPVTARQALAGEMVLPWGLVMVNSLLALGAGLALAPLLPWSGELPGWVVFLLPGAAAACGLAAAVDVLRSARSSRLFTGQAPLPGTTGALIAGVVCGLAALAVQLSGGGAFGYLLGGMVLAGATWLLMEIAAEVLQSIE